MKVGSLFSGYGGLDLAVGGDLAWYSEIEPAACKVMEAHYPGVPNLGDITKVDWSEVEPVDVITGGYPCQPFSNAGMRKGTNDERHLWPYVRDALGVLRPRRAVLENVRGHLTLGFDVVLTDLAELGMSARWGVVRAADAGAPHNRARLFIVTDTSGRQLAGIAQPGRLSEFAQHGVAIANAKGAERRAAQPNDLQARGSTKLGERTGTTTNPSSERHGGGQRSAGLGPVGGETEGSRRQTSTARQESGAGSAQDVAHASVIGCDTQWPESKGQQRQTEPDGDGSARWGDYAPTIDRWQHVIGRPAPAPTIQRAGRDRLNPVFVEWMMGLPEGWVTGHGLSASQELKMLGNGVVPQQAALALRLLGAA